MWLATHGAARASAAPFGDTVFVEPAEPINRCLGHWKVATFTTLGQAEGIVQAADRNVSRNLNCYGTQG